MKELFFYDGKEMSREEVKNRLKKSEAEFARSGPIIIPVFGKKIEVIKTNSKILNPFPTLKTTHVIKARKKSS